MPIYEYRCRGCGKEFETYVPARSTAVTCPGCRSGDIARKLSVFGLRTGDVMASMPSMSSGGGCCGGGGCDCH